MKGADDAQRRLLLLLAPRLEQFASQRVAGAASRPWTTSCDCPAPTSTIEVDRCMVLHLPRSPEASTAPAAEVIDAALSGFD